MRFLYDENLDELTTEAIAVLGAHSGDKHTHILEHSQSGLEDPDIPPLCKSLKVTSLITVNYKDFGARKVYYQSLLAAGVSVVVIRPGKLRFTPEQQTSTITRHLSRIRRELESADAPILLKVTQSEVARRSLDELVEEFESGRRKMP